MKKIIFGLSIIAMGLASFTLADATTASKKEKNAKVYGDTDTGIKFFEGSWEEALKKAKKENKIIFLDAYAAWCGPCKLMAKNTFTDEAVGEYFNEHFINFKMDMEKNAEGPRLSRKFALRAYPTLYFVDKNESLVHQDLGYKEPKDLIAAGEMALSK